MIIYKAVDKSNNLIYIGQTTSTLNERNRLRKYGTSKFDIEFNKKGEQGFTWEIIDTASNINCLNKKEIFWIKYYDSTNPDIGYNLTGGGNNFCMSDEVKSKISQSQLGEKNHMFNKKYGQSNTSKRVVELTTGIVYESGTQARDLLFENVKNVDISTGISQCCRGLSKEFFGYIFRFIDDLGNIKYLNDDTKKDIQLKMYDGSLDIIKKYHPRYVYNIITEEKIEINELSNRLNINIENLFGFLRRNGISIRKMKLPVLKLREVWLHETDFNFYLQNKDKYDFNANISKQSFIFNNYDLKEFRDADEACEYYISQGIKISKKSILDHLKKRSQFRFGIAKDFDMKYIY